MFTFLFYFYTMNLQLNKRIKSEARDLAQRPSGNLRKQGAPNQDDRDVIKERCKVVTFFLITRGIFYFYAIS